MTTELVQCSAEESRGNICLEVKDVSSPTSVLIAQGVNNAAEGSMEPIVLPPATTNSRKAPSFKTFNVETWIAPASQKSLRTLNPIRAIVDPIAKTIQTGDQRGDGKDLITLAVRTTGPIASMQHYLNTGVKLKTVTFLPLKLGDPTVGGNLPPCPQAIHGIVSMVQKTPHAAGYVHACGTLEARESIARFHSYPQHAIDAENVIVANGCSGALEIALTALLDPGTILLVPQPGFPLYQVIAESHGASVLFYRLDPDRHWEIDMDHLEHLVSQHPPERIRGIVVNNPSNPTGAVFSEAHLQQIIKFCHKLKFPIVADEVYGDLVLGDSVFYPVAQVAARLGRTVPVITTSGLAKQFLLPGWRVGWICFHDNKQGSLTQVQEGANRLAQVILGASHLAQSIVPALLAPDNPDLTRWKQGLRATLTKQAKVVYLRLSEIQGLEVIAPQGAMYAMVRISVHIFDFTNDMEFSSKLLKEENVFVLPGSAFGMPSFVRVVFCSSEPLLQEASDRIAAFCERHRKTGS